MALVDGARLKAEGADLDIKETPFVRKFYTEPDVRGARARYYEAKDQVDAATEAFRGAKKSRDSAKIDDVESQNRELRSLGRMATRRQKMVTAQRDRTDAIRLSGEYTKAEERVIVKQMERDEERMYDEFMAEFKARKAESRAREN